MRVISFPVLCRLYGLYTLEIILQVVFGHKVDVINGKVDELVDAAGYIFRLSTKGKETAATVALCKQREIPLLLLIFRIANL